MTPSDNNWQELLPLIYIQINLAVKSAVREVIAELNQQETLDSKACAEYLHLGLDCLFKKVRNGEIPHHREGKRKLIFKKEELDNYLLNIIINKDE